MQAQGMLASVSVDGPIGNAVIERYDALGNVLSLTNELGHAVTYSNHNGLGLPGRITNANGGITDYIYDPRGGPIRVRTYLSGAVQDTLYAYDGDGRLTKVTAADGVAQDYAYHTSDRDLLASISIGSSGILAGGGIQEQRSYGYTHMGNPTTARDTAIET